MLSLLLLLCLLVHCSQLFPTCGPLRTPSQFWGPIPQICLLFDPKGFHLQTFSENWLHSWSHFTPRVTVPGRLSFPFLSAAHSPGQMTPQQLYLQVTGASQETAQSPSSSPPHRALPRPLQLSPGALHKESFTQDSSSLGLLLGNWTQELHGMLRPEKHQPDPKTGPPGCSPQQLILSTPGLASLLPTLKSHLMISPLPALFSLEPSHPN